MHKKHLLVVDDDKRIRALLKKFLHENGYTVTTAGNSIEARSLITTIEFDLLVLDIMMPGEDGLSLTKDISKNYPVPILLLSARVQTSERIVGLEMGADDYLPKPFDPRELLLRVEAILKRSARKIELDIPEEIYLGDKTYYSRRRELWKGTKMLNLTSVEAKLMQIFISKPNFVVTREELLSQVLNLGMNKKENMGKSRSIDVQVKRLREKLEQDPRNPRYLKTVRGIGYILEPD